MSLLRRLQAHNVLHSICRSEELGFSDWFILCKKSHMRNVYVTTTGVYLHNKIIMYVITMTKQDVVDFYYDMRLGIYTEKYEGLEGTVYEQVGYGLKSTMRKAPYRKNKK